MGTLAAEISGTSLEPGDVVLTGSNAPISRAIQRATGSPVSHVLLAMGDGMVAEATEFLGTPSDRSGGIYLRSLHDALDGADLHTIIVRRPLGVDHDRVLAATAHFLEQQPTYSGSGLVFTGALVVLGALWTERVADLVFGTEITTTMETTIADIVADGDRRMVCAEFAYRLLHHADVPLRHDALFLADAIEHLPPVDSPVEDDVDVSITLDDLQSALRAATRTPEAGTDPTALMRLGWPTYVRLVGRQLRRAYGRRRSEVDDGDIADLITPRDFVDMRPFEDLVEIVAPD